MASATCLTGTEDLGTVCQGASADFEFTKVGGTMTFNPDGTYTSIASGGATTHYHYPPACLTNGVTCDQFGQVVQQLGMYSSVTCAMDAAGLCNCAAVSDISPSSESGTYVASGGTVTTTHGGKTDAASYCVQGNVLYETPAPSDAGAIYSGGIVFTKQ